MLPSKKKGLGHPKLSYNLDLNQHNWLFVQCWVRDENNGVTKPCYMCDWIWENPASTHNYKYLEIPNLIIWNISYNSGREADACMKFATIYSFL